MKTLATVGITTMSVSELHSEVDALTRADAPVVVLLENGDLVAIEGVEWDDEMQCYVVREHGERALVN